MSRDLSNNAWFQTIKGQPFFLFEPEAGDFDIEEIAHALSLQCRFNGHVKRFYSVAEHSLLVSLLLEEWGEADSVVLCGLLHDAAEAYTGDLVRPLKRSMPTFKTIEQRIEEEIALRFNLPYPFPEAVKRADNTMLLVERRDLLASSPRAWSTEGLELPEWKLPAEALWETIKTRFLCRFAELGGR